MNKSKSELGKMLTSKSKQEIISFIEINDVSKSIALIDDYVKIETEVQKLKENKILAASFMHFVSTLLLRVQNNSKEKNQKKFSSSFYSVIKELFQDPT